MVVGVVDVVVLVDVDVEEDDDVVVSSGPVVVVVATGDVDIESIVAGGAASELEPEQATVQIVTRTNPRISRMASTVRLPARRLVAAGRDPGHVGTWVRSK